MYNSKKRKDIFDLSESALDGELKKELDKVGLDLLLEVLFDIDRGFLEYEYLDIE